MENIKHIVQFSGGKDSTCMLLMMLEKGMQVDDIIFCDTGMEFPQMYEHIAQVEQYIGRNVTMLVPKQSYEYLMFDHVKSKGKRMGQKGNGWATVWVRWCTIALKQQLAKDFLKSAGEYISYIGIAYDEPKRHEKISKNQIHPLFDWHITESQALSFCYEHGFTWGGLYQEFKRVSCWCCPFKSLDELRVLYHKYPALWEKLKDMDNRSWNQYRADYSVEQLEERFKQEVYIKKISIPLFNDQVS